MNKQDQAHSQHNKTSANEQSEIGHANSIEAIIQKATKEGRVIPRHWLPGEDGKGGLEISVLRVLVAELPITVPPPNEERLSTVAVQVSPQVADGIRELNASVGWHPDVPCDERNIEFFVQLSDKINNRANQWRHLEKATALAFLEVYTALAERPFNQAVGPLASLAYLIKDIRGLNEERWGLTSAEETDISIRLLKWRAERGEFKI